MTQALQAIFSATPFAYSSGGDGPIKHDFMARQREAIEGLTQKSYLKDQPLANQKILVSAKRSERVVRSMTRSTGFEENIFNSLVSLKVAVSQYAMHLSSNERHRIFEQLDSMINVDDWHQGDDLPKSSSFQDFLKWMIYSKYFKWVSIGVSQDGNIMVAWRTSRVLLTANFAGSDSVRWTVQIKSEAGETGQTVGKCPLRLFAEQAMFYLEAAPHEGR
jgi:hypothetical protein